MISPIWGNLVYCADHDLLAFAWLFQGGLRVASYYHAAQAVEKYLKALALSIDDPHGATQTHQAQKRWLKTHDLGGLGLRCAESFPYYGDLELQKSLKRFSEFDQSTRYPWVIRKLGNGFSSDDVPLFAEIVHRLRSDIPIAIDDYPLGMLVRGYHHKHPETKTNESHECTQSGPLAAAMALIPQLSGMVRR